MRNLITSASGTIRPSSVAAVDGGVARHAVSSHTLVSDAVVLVISVFGA